jgi:hypothetical protein
MRLHPLVSRIELFPLSQDFVDRKIRQFEATLSNIETRVSRETPSVSLVLGGRNHDKYQEELVGLSQKLERFLKLFETLVDPHNIKFDSLDREITGLLSIVSPLTAIQKGSFYQYVVMARRTNDYLPKRVLPILQGVDHLLKQMKKSIARGLSLTLTFKTINASLFPNFGIPIYDLRAIRIGAAAKVNFEAVDHSQFSSPFISLSPANAIICCLPGIEKDIGPLIPSLSGNCRFAIMISSFIHNEVRTSLKMDNGESLFTVKTFFRPLQPIPVFAQVPPFNSSKEEVLEFSGSLELFSGDAHSIKLPLRIRFHLFPFQLYIHSERYPLAFRDGIFWICSRHFQIGESVMIDF